MVSVVAVVDDAVAFGAHSMDEDEILALSIEKRACLYVVHLNSMVGDS